MAVAESFRLAFFETDNRISCLTGLAIALDDLTANNFCQDDDNSRALVALVETIRAQLEALPSARSEEWKAAGGNATP